MPRPKHHKKPVVRNRDARPVVPAADDSAATEVPNLLPFPVVCIGASAGGIEAGSERWRAVPQGTDMAFVVVQHLDPSHSSALGEILSRATSMPVAEVRDRVAIEKGHVYVIQPGSELAISGGVLEPSRR